MAAAFHATISISIQHTSSFFLEPNQYLPPVGCTEQKSTTASVHGDGMRVREGRGKKKRHRMLTHNNEK